MSDQEHEQAKDQNQHTSSDDKKAKQPLPRWAKLALSVVVLVVAAYGLFVGYAYMTTPANIRKPAFQHYHFRMQILVDGKSVNFAEKEFQTEAGKDVCTAQLTNQPIHFHDDKDQIVHIHWDGMTGGQVLKYYGWNYYGGLHGTLGFRFDKFPKLVNVPIHGNTLPTVPQGDNFYVYTGDEHSHKLRSFDDFVHQDLEQFLGKKSNLPNANEDAGLLNKLFPKAYAHEELPQTTSTTQVSDQDLQRINNLLGNVVIFVQKKQPTEQQVQDRFNKLAPLSLSTCAG